MAESVFATSMSVPLDSKERASSAVGDRAQPKGPHEPKEGATPLQKALKSATAATPFTMVAAVPRSSEMDSSAAASTSLTATAPAMSSMEDRKRTPVAALRSVAVSESSAIKPASSPSVSLARAFRRSPSHATEGATGAAAANTLSAPPTERSGAAGAPVAPSVAWLGDLLNARANDTLGELAGFIAEDSDTATLRSAATGVRFLSSMLDMAGAVAVSDVDAAALESISELRGTAATIVNGVAAVADFNAFCKGVAPSFGSCGPFGCARSPTADEARSLLSNGTDIEVANTLSAILALAAALPPSDVSAPPQRPP